MSIPSTLLSNQVPFKASLFLKMLDRLEYGSMRLTLPDGEQIIFNGKHAGVEADLQIKNWLAVNKILQSGDIGVAEAYRDAQRIKGEGDAKASALYAQAFQQNPEFYSFYRSMEAYRSSLRNKGDLLLLEPNSDFFKYLKDSAGRAVKK